MLALSPLFSSTGAWPFEEYPITYHHGADDQMMINNIDHNINYVSGGGGGPLREEANSTDQFISIDDYAAAADCFATYNSSSRIDHIHGLHHHDQYNYDQQQLQPPPRNQFAVVDNNVYDPLAAAAADIIYAHHEVDHNNNNYGTTRNDHVDDQLDYSPQSRSMNVGGDDEEGVNTVAKKLTHNACERDRRKRINTLYSSLRDLLPPDDHKKKLSIPATVSRVLKYIPELQQEVETLIKKKEELSPNPSDIHQAEEDSPTKQSKKPRSTRRKKGSAVAHRDQDQQESGSSSVSATQLGENEISVEISTFDHRNNSVDVSEVLIQLENDGFNVLNVSSCESFGGRIFYNLHLWVEGANAIKCGWLREKILSFYQN